MDTHESDDRPRVLIVEDEQDLLELLRYNLERDGYAVAAATTGEAVLSVVRSHRPDLVLLDLMLPGMDGLEVCRRLKRRDATGAVAIIMLTAKGEEADVVRGLEAGADDYVTKPFSPRVLLARMSAVLRCVASERRDAGAGRSVIAAGPVRIDRERHEVLVDGDAAALTATEFKLLGLLRAGRVFTRQQIIESIHEGMAAVTDRSVDVLVVALRRKLGSAGRAVETVRGVGYRFTE